MDIASLIGMSFVCAMGAVSPGPSLVVVLRNTISGGRMQGIMTGIGHGLGFGIYAFIAVMGLSSLLLANEQLINLLQILGALILICLAFKLISHKQSNLSVKYEKSGYRGFFEGFMIAFLNPKILVFLVAVFSQFLSTDIDNSDRFFMVIMAGAVDTIWYVFVAAALAGTTIVNKLRESAAIIDRLIGMVLLMLSILLIVKTLGINIY